MRNRIKYIALALACFFLLGVAVGFITAANPQVDEGHNDLTRLVQLLKELKEHKEEHLHILTRIDALELANEKAMGERQRLEREINEVDRGLKSLGRKQ